MSEEERLVLTLEAVVRQKEARAQAAEAEAALLAAHRPGPRRPTRRT